MKLKALIFFIGVLSGMPLSAQNLRDSIPGKFDTLIPILNVATFHMSYTNDAHSLEFDETNSENIRQVHEIAKKIAAFKPTVILVELPPNYNPGLLKEYLAYVKDPQMKFKHPSEIELLAYEVGRLSGTEKIYGIDYQEEYNYMISSTFPESNDIATHNHYVAMVEAYMRNNPEDKLAVADLFRLMNTPEYNDFMININADILTHISYEGKAQGADEAAKYYHRNLVMYSNLNQIRLTKDDRVFILMGASHTAFFNDFLRRSPKYQVVDVTPYLN